MSLLPIGPTIQRIREFSNLPAGWNSYDAVPLTPIAIATAADILIKSLAIPIYSAGVAVDAVPSPDGGVLIEWESTHERFQLWITGDATFHGVRVTVKQGEAVNWMDIAIPNDAAVLTELRRLQAAS